jgi:hypothetical protein
MFKEFPLNVTIHPEKITRVFVFVAVLLFAAHIATRFLTLVVGDDFFYGFVPMFNFDKERNAPSYFSSLSMAFIALLVSIVAAANKGKRYFWHWTIMAAIFLFVSFDELVALHEQMIQPLRSAFEFTGFLFYPWVIVYGALLVVLIVKYARFIWDLPSKTRFLFLIAAGLYISGALGLEMVGGHIYALNGSGNNLEYMFLTTIEETLEIAGTILFIHALLIYIQVHLPRLKLKLARPAQYRQAEPAQMQAQARIEVPEQREKVHS